MAQTDTQSTAGRNDLSKVDLYLRLALVAGELAAGIVYHQPLCLIAALIILAIRGRQQ